MKLLAKNAEGRRELLMDHPLPRRADLDETRLFDESVNISNILDVGLSAKFGRIQRLDRPQTVQMLVSLRSKDVSLKKLRAGLDLVILVDVSSSMARTKIELAQETLMFVIDELEPIDRLSIIKFSDESTILTPLVSMTPDAKATMKGVVLQKLTCYGNTNVMAGLSDCFELLEVRRERNDVTSVILLSDGADTAGNTLGGFRSYIQKMEQKLMARGMDFQINCFGFGVDHDEDLLAALARQQQGNFYYIKDLKKIDECFIDCLSKLMSIYAKNVQIDVFLNGGITFGKKYGPFWGQSPGSQAKGTLTIRALKAGTDLNFLADLVVPPIGPEDVLKVAVAVLNYSEGGNSSVISRELRLEVVNHTNLGLWDPKVDDILVKFQAAEVLEKAEKQIAENKQEEATKLVSDFQNWVLVKSSETPALGAKWAKCDFQAIAKSKKVSGQARFAYENEMDDAPGVTGLFQAPQANLRKREMLARKY